MMKMMLSLAMVLGFSASASALTWGSVKVKHEKAANLYLAMKNIGPAAACEGTACTLKASNLWCTRIWNPGAQQATYSCTVDGTTGELKNDVSGQLYNSFLQAGGGIECKFNKCAFIANPTCTMQNNGADAKNDYACVIPY